MSGVIKKRLEDALVAGHNIDKEQRSARKLQSVQGSELKIYSQKDVTFGDENGIYSIALDREGNIAAVGLGTGVLQLLDCNSWEKIRRVRTCLIQSVPLLAVKFFPCKTRKAIFTGGSDGSVKVWSGETFAHEKTVEEEGNEITSLDFSNDGVHFTTGGKDSCIRLYNSDTLELIRVYNGTRFESVDSSEDILSIPGHSKKVFAVKFHPDDSNMFLSASWDHSVKVWDKRMEHAAQTVHGPFVCGDGLDILGHKILTASWLAENALQLWDYRNGSVIKSISYPTPKQKGEFLYCGRFWDDHYVVAGGSGNNSLNVINTLTDQVCETIDGDNRPVQAVEVSHKKNLLVCGTSGNVLKYANLMDE